MNETELESTIWKVKVKLYKTGTIHLTLINRITGQSRVMTIRKFRLQKNIDYIR